MKKTSTILLALLCLQSLNAQKASRQLFGNFTLDNTKILRYQYRFTQSNQIHAFRLYESKSYLDKKVDTLKLDTTMMKFKALIDSIKKIELQEEIKNKIEKLSSAALMIIEMYNDEELKEKRLKAGANYTDSLRGYITDSLALFKADSLLKLIPGSSYSFGELIDLSKNWKEQLLGRDFEEFYYLDDWNIDVFRPLFSAALKKTSVNTDSLIRNGKTVELMTNKVFFEIKSRADFANDIPIAAYIQIKDPIVELTIPINDFIKYQSDSKKDDRMDRRTKKLEQKIGREKKRFESEARYRSLKDSLQQQRQQRQQKKGPIGKMYSPLYSRFNLSLIAPFEFRNAIKRDPPIDVIKDVPITFEVYEITVEFEDGTIKNIFADMIPYYKTKRLGPSNFTIRFRNSTPISMSGKYDPEKFVSHSIYAGDPRELYKYLIPHLQTVNRAWDWDDHEIKKLLNKDERNNYKSEDFSISLSDLIRYDPVSEIDNEDYSPENSVVKISPQAPIATLNKEYRSKIITVKAFSDFIGIRDDQPNGLIQFEASRKINVWTKRKRFLGMPLGETSYFWLLTYIEPRLTISKIENNNKALLLDTTNVDMSLGSSTGIPNFRLNALLVRQYQNFNFSTFVNLFKLNFHNIKSSFHFNGHAGFMRTLIADSLKFIKDSRPIITENVNERNLNTFNWGFNIIYELKPDSRYGFQFGYEWNKLSPKSAIYSLEPGNRLVQAFWSEGFLKTGDESKLFFRFRYNNLRHKQTINFMQVQMGYLLDLFKAAKRPAGNLQIAN